MGVARLRREGFASLEAVAPRPGMIVTRPVLSGGDQLLINARCKPRGWICVAVTDIDGRIFPGHRLEDCKPFTGDAIRHRVTWGAPAAAIPSAGGFRKLIFSISEAELFSFQMA